MRLPAMLGRASAAATALLVFGGFSAEVSAVTDRHARILALPDGRAIALTITVGEVRIVGEPRTDVGLEVVREAPDRASLARIPLIIDEQPALIDIRATQQEDGREASLRTDVTLRVPVGAPIESIRIFEGRLELRGLAGRVTAELQRGPIEASSVSGAVRLETAIGSVIVRDARLLDGGLLRLRTFNGDVRLGLAERPSDARILVLALNGTIRSDIPLAMKETWGPRWGETTVGRGERVISIDVVTGHVEITSK